ncbi:gliding motility-associated C-terminal domain-containing protein [Candidatus Bipolaricaulota bacterium]
MSLATGSQTGGLALGLNAGIGAELEIGWARFSIDALGQVTFADPIDAAGFLEATTEVRWLDAVVEPFGEETPLCLRGSVESTGQFSRDQDIDYLGAHVRALLAGGTRRLWCEGEAGVRAYPQLAPITPEIGVHWKALDDMELGKDGVWRVGASLSASLGRTASIRGEASMRLLSWGRQVLESAPSDEADEFRRLACDRLAGGQMQWDGVARGVCFAEFTAGPPASIGFGVEVEMKLAAWRWQGRRDGGEEVDVVGPDLRVDDVVVNPNPSGDGAIFTFEGSGVPDTIAVEIYDVSGNVVWSGSEANVGEIVWEGTDEAGTYLPEGVYIYQLELTGPDGSTAFTGKVFLGP